MTKYLYEIDYYSKNERCGFCEHGIPVMPRVLAEKTAKALNRSNNNPNIRYSVSKTTCKTVDGTPHGFNSWFDYIR